VMPPRWLRSDRRPLPTGWHCCRRIDHAEEINGPSAILGRPAHPRELPHAPAVGDKDRQGDEEEHANREHLSCQPQGLLSPHCSVSGGGSALRDEARNPAN